jgi:hypothetical protein
LGADLGELFCVRGEVSSAFWGVLVGGDEDNKVVVGEFVNPVLDSAGCDGELFGEGVVFVPHKSFATGLADDGHVEEAGADGDGGELGGLLDEHSGSGTRDIEVGEEAE